MKINEILAEAKSAYPQQAAKAIAMKKAGIKPKNESVELEEEFDLIESIIERLAQHNGVDAEVIWEDLETLTEDELYAFAVTSEPIMESQDMAEGSDSQLDINQLAAISDAALDAAYGYGRSSPGNTFGWQANLKSAAYAKQMIDRGATDIETISDAIHKGWNVTARAFVQDPDQFDDTEKLKSAGKLEAKLQQREKLMNIGYAQLSDEEQEKDRVVARALLQALTGQQGVAEGLPQTLRKVIPGYARREIDKKMDAEKFGKTDVDRDANFQRYKKIQDKLKEQDVAEDWQKANKRDKTDGMSQKAVNAYRRENPGSKLKTAVTTKPGKLKKGGKASKRRKSYCSRSRGQMKMHSISCAKTPDKAICKARRRWNC